MIEFREGLSRHQLGVGVQMFDYAKNMLGKSDDYCLEMFVLGNIHDMGRYIFKDQSKHDIMLAKVLEDCGYKYYREVSEHSKYCSEYQSDELNLLWFADCTVSSLGERCTFESRLKDIESRYGTNSIEYNETLYLVEYLRDKGFNDTFSVE